MSTMDVKANSIPHSWHLPINVIVVHEFVSSLSCCHWPLSMSINVLQYALTICGEVLHPVRNPTNIKCKHKTYWSKPNEEHHKRTRTMELRDNEWERQEECVDCISSELHTEFHRLSSEIVSMGSIPFKFN